MIKLQTATVRLLLTAFPFASCASLRESALPPAPVFRSSLPAAARPPEPTDPELGRCIQKLKSPDEEIRFRAVGQLLEKTEAGKQGLQIREAVPALVDALSDETPVVRSFAARALANFAFAGGDVSGFAGRIESAVAGCSDAAQALVWHYLRKGEWNTLAALVLHADSAVQSRTSIELEDAVKEGRDILPLLQRLGMDIQNGNGTPRIAAFLGRLLRYKKTRDPVLRIFIGALERGNLDVRLMAAHRLRLAAAEDVDLSSVRTVLTRILENEVYRSDGQRNEQVLYMLRETLQIMNARQPVESHVGF